MHEVHEVHEVDEVCEFYEVYEVGEVYEELEVWVERRVSTIILQDSALLQLHYPNHYVFRHPLFQTDIFKAYALPVVKANNTTETPMDLQLQ